MAEIDVTRIAGNIGAMNALNSLMFINKQLSVHQTRLATGKRINTAADDPAGLTIATKMLSRSEGLKVALGNIGDAKNLLAVAESGLGRINDILVQMRNKAEAAASDTIGPKEREAIVTQLKAYAAQIDDITTQTEWNGVKLINGSYSAASGNSLSFQTGAGKDDTTSVSGLEDMAATGNTLSLASRAVGSSATKATDGDGILTAVASAAKANANLSELSGGTYTVRVTMDDATGVNDKVELLDSAGNSLLISQTPADGTGNVAKSLLVNLDGDQAINFGNGLTVTIKGGKAGGAVPYTATVSYTKDGDYSIKSGGVSGNDLDNAQSFRDFMGYVGERLDMVSDQLSKIGALTGRLTFKEDQVSAAQINVEAAYNRIMNANMAEEQVQASKFIILQQTATAMLAQANAAPQFLLSLFR